MTGSPPAQPDPNSDLTQAGLVVIAEATALHDDDPVVIDAARENLLDTVDELVDEPLTPRQEEVVEAISIAAGTLTAGLSGALASVREKPVADVLTGAAATLFTPNNPRPGDASTGE
ncbi:MULTISPECIES: hypothetical protein [unclassified Frondihabitans]|uniref:hypothetical protein n=1 Tax=unclassified Frondihabitans TaxID=2626248 RepID=UPI000F50D493|nr:MULTISPECIES: hypothetical protein [unclassified Frondihabitans]RPE78267.1 hypothetical protein EDF37_0939 [Frondihabitans sp. PhB153]RPF08548.1 hypothetical protein EDF39_0941 [Frondihabitans sp. PhB161]